MIFIFIVNMDKSLFFTIKYSNKIKDSLLETTLIVVDENNGFKTVELLHYPDTKQLTVIDSKIATLRKTYNLNRVYIFGDHDILRNIKSLLEIPVIDIRETTICQRRLVNLTKPFISAKPRFKQPLGTKILPNPEESIINSVNSSRKM